jgi:hypothetical protein
VKDGGISLDINWNVFDSVIKMLKSEQGSSIFILNSHGGIIYNPNINKKTSIDFQAVIKKIDKSKSNVSYYKMNSGIPLKFSTLDYIHDKLSSISYGMENLFFCSFGKQSVRSQFVRL